MENRTKAGFRALRETTGLSQENVAAALGIAVRTVIRWEAPGEWRPSDAAWELVESYAERQRQMCAYAVEAVEKAAAAGLEPHSAVLTYYRSQEEYDRLGRDEGPYTVANANARAAASALIQKGASVEFRYPDEGAVQTPGSRY